MDREEDLKITADSDHMTSQLSSMDTFTSLPPLTISDLSSLDTISIGTSGVFTSALSSGAQGTLLNTANNWNHTQWSSYNYPKITGSQLDSSLSVKGDAEFEGDVKIQGHSILHLLKKIEDRLAVLQEPSPERLEKFAALKKAYEHYKTLERLIGEE